MKDFLIQNKIFITVVTVTLALLFGGVYLFTRNGTSTTNAKISSSILVTPQSFKTNGIDPSGKYLPENSSASATLVEFGDYQCPACGAYHPLVKQLITDESSKINFVFRNFPLSQHANANISAYAVEAAGLQGKFWEMHDKVYETQKDWSDSTSAKDIFIEYAKNLGLDVNKFKSDIDSKVVTDKVKNDANDGNLAKVDSTPTFFLNGTKLQVPGSLDEFKKLIEATLAKETKSN